MADKERIDRAPVLGMVTYQAAPPVEHWVKRAQKAETELERLREGVKALAEEWETGPLVGYGQNEQVELDTEKQHARLLRGLLDEDGGA